MKKLHLAIIAAVIAAIVIAAVFCVAPLLSPAEHPQNVVQIYCNAPNAQITFYELDTYKTWDTRDTWNTWTVRFIDGVAEYHFDPYSAMLEPELIGYRITAPGYFEVKGAFTVEYELSWMTFSVDMIRRY